MRLRRFIPLLFHRGLSPLDAVTIALAENEVRKTYGDTVSVESKGKRLLKFGKNDTIAQNTLSTIWSNGTEIHETYATGNDIDSIVSDDATNTQDIKIEGHTISGSDLTFVVQTATLNGQTPVTLGTSLYRASRAYVDDSTDMASSSKAYVYESGGTVTNGVPQTASDIHILVFEPSNQSLKASTSLSSQDYFFITFFYADINKKQAAVVDIYLEVRQSGGVFRPVLTRSMQSAGDGNIDMTFPTPLIVPKNADIRVTAESDSAATSVSAGFGGYLAIITG